MSFSVAIRDLDHRDQRHLAEIVAPNVLRRQLTNEYKKLSHVEGLRVIEICSSGRAQTAQTARDGTVDARLRPPRKLQEGDFAVMVNGRSSRSEILEELRSGRLVTAIVWRFPQPLQLEQPRGWERCQVQKEAAHDKGSESRAAP